MPCGRRRRRGAAGLGSLLAVLGAAAVTAAAAAASAAAASSSTAGRRPRGATPSSGVWPSAPTASASPSTASSPLCSRPRTALHLSLRAFDLASLTVDQLRDALRRRGLKTGGKKDELLARLREDIQRAQQEERGLMMQGMEEESKAQAPAATTVASKAPTAMAAPPSAGKAKAIAVSGSTSSKTAEPQPQQEGKPQQRQGRGRAAGARAQRTAAPSPVEVEYEEVDDDDGMSLEDRLIESLAAEVRAHQQRAAAGPGDGAGAGAGKGGASSSQQGGSAGQQPPLLDPTAAAAPVGNSEDEEQLALLESLPDYPRDAPQLQIKERHVGWDGALEGYTLGDGTYVSVKEDPRMSDKDRRNMEEKFRREILRWEADYPEKWQELMDMCDQAAARKVVANVAAAVVGRADAEEQKGEAAGTTPLLAASTTAATAAPVKAGKTEEEAAAAQELERQVAAIEKLEGERKLAALPMAAKLEEWEAARMAQARPVDVINTGKAKARRRDTDTAAAAAADGVEAAAAAAPVVEEEEEEEEYVPIDAMFRDELDVNAADGNSMRAYLVSSKLAQKFWRRKERPVVLLLTDDRGWRSVQTRKLADHLAFLTNHVVLVPDLYRGDSWDPQAGTQALREFRARHPPFRLLQDARAAMEALVRNYNATSSGVIGFGVGGGQALSAVASGFMKADAVVAVCPVGHDAGRVAGAMRAPTLVVAAGENSPEAPLADVVMLMEGFAENKALPYMIRVFRDCHPGFVTRPRRGEEARAEDAVMLATSWLEIQMRNGGRAKLIRDSRVI